MGNTKRKTSSKYKVGDIFQSKHYGEFKIIEDLGVPKPYGAHYFRVRFEDPVYETVVDTTNMVTGNVKNPYFPNVCGVACIGIMAGPACLHENEYNRWYSMISRCYCANNSRYNEYGGAGVTVCKRWLCFEYYYEDIQYIPGYENFKASPREYHLDKDILQSHLPKCQRVYSKETCLWVDYRTNQSQMSIDLNSSSKYIGVSVTAEGRFRASIYYDGKAHYLGVYTSEIAAANAYNHQAMLYVRNPVLNDVPFMTQEEVYSYSTSKPREMCKIVG